MGRLMSGAAPQQFLWGNTPAACLVPKGDPSMLLPGGGGAEAGGSPAAAGELAAGEQAADQPAVAAEPAGDEQGAGGSSSDGASAGGAAPPSTARSLLSLPEAHVCFAASGDIRNLVATVNGLDADHPVRLWRWRPRAPLWWSPAA